jgi:hypothetical protein
VAAYHEAFWVVTGTAAPVIALAVVVVMADVYFTFTSLVGKIRRDARGRPRSQPEVRQEARRAARQRATGPFGLAASALILGSFTLGAQSNSLYVSLRSIEHARNVTSPDGTVWMISGGVAGLYILALLAGLFRFVVDRRYPDRRAGLAAPRATRRSARPRARPRWQSRPSVRRRRR